MVLSLSLFHAILGISFLNSFRLSIKWLKEPLLLLLRLRGNIRSRGEIWGGTSLRNSRRGKIWGETVFWEIEEELYYLPCNTQYCTWEGKFPQTRGIYNYLSPLREIWKVPRENSLFMPFTYYKNDYCYRSCEVNFPGKGE